MAFNINSFRSALRYGGARTNLFQVKITNPVNGQADSVLPFLCRATNVPQKDTNPISVSYFGRAIKVAGVTQNYSDWEVTIIGDEDHLIRNAMEEWVNSINSPIGNIRRLPTSEQSLYKSIADVTLYSQNGNVLREYKFNGIWPISVGSIGMDWGQDDVISYPVSFSVDYWTSGDQSTTGFAGGTDI
jgi:hypothetical protein